VSELWQCESECSEMLTSAFRRMLEILPDACVNTLDRAGRTVLHWAVAHHSTWAVNELLFIKKAELDVTFQTQCYWDITELYLILLYEYDLRWDLEWTLWGRLKDQLNTRFGIRCARDFAWLPLLHDLDPLSCAVLMGKKKFAEQVMGTEVICSHLCTSLTPR